MEVPRRTCGRGLIREHLDLRFKLGDAPLSVFSDVGVRQVGAALVACLHQRIDGCGLARGDLSLERT